MSKKKAEETLWQSHRPELYRMHELESKSLPSIMYHMKSRYDFRRSKPQYERVFRKWGFKKKNISTTEWRYIEARLSEREAQGKLDSCVKIRGELVPVAKIRKQRRNYRMTTLDHHRLMARSIPRPITPISVEISTPLETSPVLQPVDVLMDELKQSLKPISNAEIFGELRVSYAEKTPWRLFINLLSALNIQSEYQKGLSQLGLTESRFLQKPDSYGETRNRLLMSFSVFEETIDGLMLGKWSADELVHPAVFNTRPYLPAGQEGSPDIDVYGTSTLSSRGRELELLKYSICLISNNFAANEVVLAIVELTRSGSNLAFFERLLNQGLITMGAVAEKLLLPAVKGLNYNLVETLLKSGVNPNYSNSDGDTLLQHAIETSNEMFLLTLFDSGATVSESDQTNIRQSRFPLLEIAVAKADLTIIRHVYQHFRGTYLCPRQVLIIATSRGDLAVLRFVIAQDVEAFEELKEEPWLLFEAAALSESIPMFDYLRAQGFDIRATDEDGCGNPLVFAADAENFTLVEYLLRAGVDISSHAHIPGKREKIVLRNHLLSIADTPNPAYHGAHSVLEAAVWSANVNMVRHLIIHGAQLNEPGTWSLTMLAVHHYSFAVLQELLFWGAKFPTVPPDFRLQHEDTPVNESFNLNERISKDVSLSTNHDETVLWCSNILEDRSTKADNLGSNGDSDIESDTSSDSDSECDIDDNFDSSQDDYDDYHGEHRWNPLLFAGLMGAKELFPKLLVLAIQHNKNWMTRRCLRACIRNFDGLFVEQLLKDAWFPQDAIDQSAIVLHHIERNNQQCIQTMFENRILKKRHATVAFIQAILLERLDIVRLFLDYGYWPDDFPRSAYQIRWRGQDGSLRVHEGIDSALEKALLSKNEAMKDLMRSHYRRLLKENDPSILDLHFRQAYSIAVACGDIDLASTLKRGLVSHEVSYPAMFFTDSDHYILVRLRSSLQLAAGRRQYHTVQWILNENAEVFVHEEEYFGSHLFSTSLQCAVRDGQFSVAKRLLDNGANVNAKPINCNGATALQFAAINGQFDIFQMLLEAGATLNAPPSAFEGRTVIEGASERGRLDMVSYLLELGADIKGRANLNYRRSVYRAWRHNHYALARMIHRWKVENDEDYCELDDSIDAVLATLAPTTLVFTNCKDYGDELERDGCYTDRICGVCVGDVDASRVVKDFFSEEPLAWLLDPTSS